MKRGWFVLLVALCVLTSSFAEAGERQFPEFIIPYDEFRGQQIEMKYDARYGRISLRIKIQERDWRTDPYMTSDEALVALRKEALRLTSSDTPVLLADTGYIFRFESGKPIWGPYGLSGPEGRYQCLFFAEGASVNANVNEGVISARGREVVVGWNGYKLWQPHH